MTNCSNANCDHPLENHINMDGSEKCICNGSITCTCEKFEVQVLEDFAQRIEVEKAKRKSIYDRAYWLLENLEPIRNAGERTFYKVYIEIWYGFKIRKAGTMIDTKVWERLPNQDSVNREKRRVKQKNPDMATYDKEVLMHQTAIFQALVEMAVE